MSYVRVRQGSVRGGTADPQRQGASGSLYKRPDTLTRMPDEPRPLAEIFAGIAERVARLSVDRRNPELFHIRKSDLAHELRAVARSLGRSA